VAGHVATFVIAARAAGSTATVTTLLPVALLVLVASGVPTNIAGWGPREGAAAWVFAAAGLGAAAGVRASVVYGVLALVATLPGAAVLVVDALRRDPVPATAVPVERGTAPLEVVAGG
jgi:glycosyltransferase 2 family protein